MKTNISLIYLLLFIVPSFTSFAQAPSFGIASTFVVFTTTGAITSTAGVSLAGNLGRETAGAISGFDGSNVNGKIYVDVEHVTTKCSGDLNATYSTINSIPDSATTNHNGSATFGNETMSPGVIRIGTTAAGTAGDITFDGKGDSNSVFIIQMRGAFSTSAGFNCFLINNAKSRNIIWVIEGALTFGAGNHLFGSFLSLNGAVVVGADCTLEGRLTSTTGAMTLTNLHANAPQGNFKNYWDGSVYKSSDWFNTINWTINVPDANSDILISSNADANPFYPVISSLTTSQTVKVSNLTIENGALLTITNNSASGLISKLSVSGAIIDSNGINATAGTLEFNGTSVTPQIMPQNMCVNNTIQNLILCNSVTMNGTQNITGNLSFTGNSHTLITNDFLVFKSTANGTGQLADITNGGTTSANTIIGKASIERYITPKRAWRLLSVPIINTTDAPTINTAWQEGATTDITNNKLANPNPGYGTFITGGSTDNGYDIGVNFHPSLKVYDTLTNTFAGIPVGTGTGTGYGTYVPITSYPAYFIFVRGDRGALLLQGVNTVPTNTVLRIAGNVNTNDQTVALNGQSFTLVSNPYPAAINFATITKNNVANNLYVWNPQLSTIGGYVTISADQGTTNYIVVPSTTNSSQYIQSGDAFFVQAFDKTQSASITMKETDKNSIGSDNVFRPMFASSSMRVNLSGINAADSSLNLVDGVFTSYADNYVNAVDHNDVTKIYNINENLCLGRDKQLLAIERRQTILTTDTSYLKIYLLKKQQYQFAISAGNMDSGITAVFKDKYDTTLNNKVIQLDGALNTIKFTVNADPGSFAADRFSIVYNKPLIVLPIKFAGIEVHEQQKDILLSWKIANEINIKEYSIETATSANAFRETATVLASFNTGVAAAYNWLDVKATEGIHYYRVKSIGFTGKETYSSIVTITVNVDHAIGAVNAYPNLIKGNRIAFKLNNIAAATYSVTLLNMDGQVLKIATVQHDGSNSTLHFIDTMSTIASGKYILQVSGNATKFSTALIKE